MKKKCAIANYNGMCDSDKFCYKNIKGTWYY